MDALKGSVSCMYCDKTLSKKKILTQHVRRVHGREPIIAGNLICSFSECGSTFRLHSQLRKHLRQFHHVFLANEEVLTFQSFAEFKSWKSEEEQKTFSSYVRNTSAKAGSLGKISYFICHRSGEFPQKCERVRALKSQGSCRSGVACPSKMNVVEKDDGVIEVTYFKTHHGHSNSLCDLGKLHLSPEEREVIAGKLKDGVSTKRILDEIRDSISEQNVEFKRIHLTTQKDINNVQQSFRIGKDEQLHSSDSISVELFVNKMQSEGNSVLLFKQQGKDDPKRILEKSDFMLVIMTPIQREMLEKFGRDSCICVDTTHGTTGYDFQLTTLLVVDEFGSGFPVSFCLSTKIDYTSMCTFFSSIKESIGTIYAKTFMSDDAPAYINAWRAVMGSVGHHLLCAWHVDRNWKNNLSRVSGDVAKKAMVYKVLTTLLHESRKSTFIELLEGAVELFLMYEETHQFGLYFKRTYVDRPEVWAYCYREQAGINTNMHLENMHKVLKYSYFQGKKNKRVDRCISCLLKLVRDKTFDRMVKLAKGSLGGRLKAINLSHRRGQDIAKTDIRCVEHECVIGMCKCRESAHYSINSTETVYFVRKMEKNCTPSTCHLMCKICDICVHDYSCSCLNFIVQCNMCKHIHAVAGFVSHFRRERQPVPQNVVTTSQSNMEDIVRALATEGTEQQSPEDCRTVVAQELQKALECVRGASLPHTLWEEVLQDTKQLILKVLKNDTNGSLQLKEPSEPHNKKIEKQESFFSVKQRQAGKGIFEKPTPTEMSLIADSLTGVGKS